MRVKFRILLYMQGKRLRKSDLRGFKDPLHVGMRYVTEFKYLEATKWLLISPDSWERTILLGLINLALGQEEQAQEFLGDLSGLRKVTDVEVFVELPQKDKRLSVKTLKDIHSLLQHLATA